jgi:formylglycine-generating enzyme
MLAFLLLAAEVPSMIRIAPGAFMAGSAAQETQAAGHPPELAAYEQPVRLVRMTRAFAMMRTEVTREAFGRFVAATGWRPDGPCSHLVDGPANRWRADLSRNWSRPGFEQDARHPVVCVNLADAQAYARWLSAQTGRRFRLPSGDEWEYAARAGTVSARWWRDEARSCAAANLSDRRRARAHNGGEVDPAKFFACDDGYVFTAPVGSFRANPWGLRDMLGNVWEWTTDCVDAACRSVFDRGASWTNSPRYVRAAAKHPELRDARTTVLGFRLVEDLP